MKICSYLKAVGILEHPQNWALCAGLVGYSTFYWLLKKTLRRAESGFEFTLHPQHFIILNLSIWEVMLFIETEDGTPVRRPRGEKHGGEWVKPPWLSCEQSHRKPHFILPWVRFCPVTIIGHAAVFFVFVVTCGWRSSCISTAFASPLTAPIPMTWPWQPNTCVPYLSTQNLSKPVPSALATLCPYFYYHMKLIGLALWLSW